MSCTQPPDFVELLDRSLTFAQHKRSRRPVRCLQCGVTFLTADAWARHFTTRESSRDRHPSRWKRKK